MNIELPVPNANLLKKEPPTSFYQQCNHLVQLIWSLSSHHEINKDMENGYDFGKELFPLGTENVEGFVYDPVTVLWDFCSLGSPLCAIMNLFKDSQKIKIIEIEPNFPLEITMKKRQKSVFLFIKSCKDTLKMTDAELFTISDVFRDDTNYFIKVFFLYFLFFLKIKYININFKIEILKLLFYTYIHILIFKMKYKFSNNLFILFSFFFFFFFFFFKFI